MVLTPDKASFSLIMLNVAKTVFASFQLGRRAAVKTNSVFKAFAMSEDYSKGKRGAVI